MEADNHEKKMQSKYMLKTSRESKEGATFICSFLTIICWAPFSRFPIHANVNKAPRHCPRYFQECRLLIGDKEITLCLGRDGVRVKR